MSALSETDRQLLLAGLPMLQVVELPLPGCPLIYYRETGPDDGIPVVMLPGGSSDSGDYRAQLAGLGGGFKLYAWSTPGYGGSSPVTAPEPTGEDFADHFLAFVRALGLKRFHIVASSLGTVIAMCFAAQHPDLVQSMVLLSPNSGYGRLEGADRDAWLKAWLDPSMILQADPNVLARQLTTQDADEILVLRVGAMRESVTDFGFRQVIRMMANVDTLSKAPALEMPISIVAGEADIIAPLPEHSQPIADALPNGALTVLPGLGHLMQLEAPDTMNRHIADFVRQHHDAPR